MSESIQPLPVPVRAYPFEVVASYAPRAAAANASEVKVIEDVERARGTLLGAGRDSASRRALWRALGRLPDDALEAPRAVAGNWVEERDLCERCTDGVPALGRPWNIGYVCAEHEVWLPGRRRLPGAPWLATAEQEWREVLAPRGVVVNCQVARLGFEAAQVGISRSLLDSRATSAGLDPTTEWEPLVYPEAVGVARLVTSTEFVDTHLGDLPGRERRSAVVEAVHRVLPDVGDADAWRAVARVWDCALSLHRAALKARALGQPVQEPWNVVQYGSDHQEPGPEVGRVVLDDTVNEVPLEGEGLL